MTLPVSAEMAALILERFTAIAERDAQRLNIPDSLRRWLFVDRLYARGQRKEMNFYGYEGPDHLVKYLSWISNFNYPDYFPAPLRDSLVKVSVDQDSRCLARLGLQLPLAVLDTIGKYNAQDYILQRFYPVPEEQRLNRILDFGAGHGRAANLAFFAPDNTTELLVSVDGIPASYLTQRLYYSCLDLKFQDYIDAADDSASFDFHQAAEENQLIHIPTWRMDVLPSDYFDLVSCVQVLKEIPRRLLCAVIDDFARILKPGGALYIRDHLQFHDPSHMPIDELLMTSGFVLEFRPNVKDRRAIHGVPRIWRKYDRQLYLTEDD